MARKMFREAIDSLYRRRFPARATDILYNKIGIAYHHMQNFTAAKKSYEQSLKLNPSTRRRATTWARCITRRRTTAARFGSISGP